MPVARRRSTAVERGSFRHRNLPLLLLQAREGVIGRFRPILHEHGVTELQWRIVRALLEHGSLEPRQIGAICRISSPSLAGVLSRMDDLGLVARVRVTHDRGRGVEIGRIGETHSAEGDDRNINARFAVRFGPHGGEISG